MTRLGRSAFQSRWGTGAALVGRLRHFLDSPGSWPNMTVLHDMRPRPSSLASLATPLAAAKIACWRVETEGQLALGDVEETQYNLVDKVACGSVQVPARRSDRRKDFVYLFQTRADGRSLGFCVCWLGWSKGRLRRRSGDQSLADSPPFATSGVVDASRTAGSQAIQSGPGPPSPQPSRLTGWPGELSAHSVALLADAVGDQSIASGGRG